MKQKGKGIWKLGCGRVAVAMFDAGIRGISMQGRRSFGLGLRGGRLVFGEIERLPPPSPFGGFLS